MPPTKTIPILTDEQLIEFLKKLKFIKQFIEIFF